MPESLDEQATDTVRNILVDNWDPTATHAYDPTLDPANSDDALPIHFGNYSAKLADPQVSVAQPNGEFTIGGRWSGKNMQSGEMNQFRRGSVLVQCWAESGASYNGETAKSIVSSLREEVEAVLGGFELGPASGPNSGVIWSFSTEWNGRFPDPVEDAASPRWQSQVRVTYDWERTV